MSNTEDTKGVIRIRKSKDRQNLCVLFTDRTTTPPQPTNPTTTTLPSVIHSQVRKVLSVTEESNKIFSNEKDSFLVEKWICLSNSSISS